jgi:hypothetical protein
MRMLVNKSIFAEPEPGFYAHTPVSLVICAPNMTDLLSHRLILYLNSLLVGYKR